MRRFLSILVIGILLSLSVTPAVFAAPKPAVIKSVVKKKVKKTVKKKVIKKKVEHKMPITPKSPITVPPETTAPAPVSHKVTIKNFAYSPAAITVKKGDVVEFFQEDTIGHTVTADNSSANPGFASAGLSQGQKFTFTFNTVGTFGYHCNPHPSMTGKVIVTE